MTAIIKTMKTWSWRQWLLAVFAVLYVLYVALSYLYLPGKLKDVVQTDVAQLLGRDIRVERIAFNPFTLSLTVDKLAIADRPQLPLVAWNKLFVNFDAWGSLFGWQIRFSKVQLDMPRVAIERRKQDFNFSDILIRLAGEEPAQPKPKSKTALALRIDDILIRKGLFAFDDLSGSIPAHSKMDDISVEVRNLYLATGDDQLNPISLQAVMPGGGQLALKGDYRADPLKVAVHVQAGDVHLDEFKDFIANQVPLQVNNGRLTLQGDVDVEMRRELQIWVQNGQVRVTDLAVDDANPGPPLLRGRQLQAQGIAMNLTQRQFRIEDISLAGVSTHQWLDDEGRPRIQPLLPQEPKAVAPPPTTAVAGTTAAPQPWDFSIGRLALRNSRLGFTDRRDGLNATQQVKNLNATLSNIRFSPDAQIPLQLSAVLNETGDLKVDGRVVAKPFALNLHYQLQGLALTPFNPYVEQASWLRVRQGSLDVDGDVKMHSGDPLPLTLDVNAGVNDLAALDSRSGTTVLQWRGLQLDTLRLDLAQRSVTIDKVAVTAPQVAAEVNAKKQMNLATLMKPAAAAEDQTTMPAVPASVKPAPQRPWRVAINQIRVKQGSARFRDASVKPLFKADMAPLDFKLDRLSSAGGKPATFTLTAKVDKYAPFEVKGTLAPLQQQPGVAFTSRLQGLEMPTLSPYTGTYIGRNLKSGQLALDLKYQVSQRKLKGDNNIVAKQLYLGDEVASEQAVHLPIGLGLALLRDASGVIDVDLGVSGNLDDPGFSVSGIVWKALKNLIVKVATSPFKLLASLVGSSEDLGAVEFGAGDSALSDASQGRLQQLAKALAQRPQLAVTVHGSAGSKDDDAALQRQRLLEQIAAQRKLPVTDLQPATLLDDKANRQVLEQLNAALQLPDRGQREETLQKADPQLQGDALIQQVYAQMQADVAARQVIGQQDLLVLADRRALAIKQYLVETAGLDQARVKLLKTRDKDLKGRTCELGVEPE
jgi:uncharacterized protein involved in outer membrane biogenesis